MLHTIPLSRSKILFKFFDVVVVKISFFFQKNETEKEFLKLQEAHEGQQALLQKLQVSALKSNEHNEFYCVAPEPAFIEAQGNLVTPQG